MLSTQEDENIQIANITTENSWFQMAFGIVIDNKVKIEVHIGSTCQKQKKAKCTSKSDKLYEAT